MLWMGFEPTIPAFERAKHVHALDRAATVMVRPSFILPSLYFFASYCSVSSLCLLLHFLLLLPV
jgi:hypothetical protein